MPTPPLSFPFPSPAPCGFGFAEPAASVGASQRASLGRGLAFVLVLAASSLASVYIPLACHGIDGTAPVRLSASR